MKYVVSFRSYEEWQAIAVCDTIESAQHAIELLKQTDCIKTEYKIEEAVFYEYYCI